MALFKRAERQRVFLKLALMGPSGSGKSFSALELAKGLANGGQIAAIDTENRSLSLYADRAVFDVVDLTPPFHPKKYIEAIREAEAAGYSVIILDSLTHAWKWILDTKDGLDKGGGNSFTNWGKVKPVYEELKEVVLQSRLHVIVCMRAKDEYVLEKNDKGKDAPRKVGMGAIAEAGAEYEYTVVWQLGMDHRADVSKDRTGLFAGEMDRITPEIGTRLLAWLESALPAPDPVPAPPATPQRTAPPEHPVSPWLAALTDADREGSQAHLPVLKAYAKEIGRPWLDVVADAKALGAVTLADLAHYPRSAKLLENLGDSPDDYADFARRCDAKGLLPMRVLAQAYDDGVTDWVELSLYPHEMTEAELAAATPDAPAAPAAPEAAPKPNAAKKSAPTEPMTAGAA